MSDTDISEKPFAFTNLVSRGKLTHPTMELLQFSVTAYHAFLLLQSECSVSCILRLSNLLHILIESLPFTSSHESIICKTLANTFFSGFVRKVSDSCIPRTPLKALHDRKCRKLSSC